MDQKTITCVSTEGVDVEFKEDFKNLSKVAYDTLEEGDDNTVKGLAISTASYNMIKDYAESSNYNPETYDWYKRGVPKPTNTNADLNETDRAFCEKYKFRDTCNPDNKFDSLEAFKAAN